MKALLHNAVETLFIHFPFSIRAIIAILIDNQIPIS